MATSDDERIEDQDAGAGSSAGGRAHRWLAPVLLGGGVLVIAGLVLAPGMSPIGSLEVPQRERDGRQESVTDGVPGEAEATADGPASGEGADPLVPPGSATTLVGGEADPSSDAAPTSPQRTPEPGDDQLPPISVPTITVPGVTVPVVTVPPITVPGVTVPPITVPDLGLGLGLGL